VKVAVTALGAVLLAVVPASSARADDVRLLWPLQPAQVTRGFDAPAPDWQRGHRGVDLAGEPGQPVYAAAPGTVVYAGVLAGRPVVSVEHDGGLRTSYEPVQAVVRAGQRVGAESALGRLVAGHPGCPAPACLHWGAMWGPAQHARYVDPLGLVADTPVRLKPWG
jgi:murein DD-endopeptidase MepM/ murein hydrolase activator NlpD